MNYNIKNGILEMQGFDIGGKILISDACEVTFSDVVGVFSPLKEFEYIGDDK